MRFSFSWWLFVEDGAGARGKLIRLILPSQLAYDS